MATRPIAVVFALALVPHLGWSQVPLGERFRVNTHTLFSQSNPAVSVDGSGRFVVVWQDYGLDGSQRGVFGRRYDADGAPLDPVEFQVNTFVGLNQMSPRVGSAEGGGFVVVWESGADQDGSLYGVFARRYDASGAALSTEEFRVNSYTTLHQRSPAVAVRPDGSFVTVWPSFQQLAGGTDLFGQRFDTAGAPAGPEFQVSTHTDRWHADPQVAFDTDGDFVVAYYRDSAVSATSNVFFQRFDATGARLGSEIRVNSYTSPGAWRASVAMQPDGGFVLVWQGEEQNGGLRAGSDVFGRRFDAAGSPVAGEFRVNSYTTGRQEHPHVATDGAGNFVVVWQSLGQKTFHQVFGRWYDASGTPVGAEFRVDNGLSGQRYPAVAAREEGQFVVTWQANGSYYDIFGQRFAPDRIFGDGFESGGGT